METRIDTDEKSRFWRRHIDRWQRGGWSQSNYCRRNNLALSTFQLWRRRLMGGHRPPACDTECVDLVPIPKSLGALERGHGQYASAIVVCVGAYRIEVSDCAQVGTLAAVINALEAR